MYYQIATQRMVNRIWWVHPVLHYHMVQEIWLHILNLQVKQWPYQQETWNIVHDNCDRHIAVGYYSTSVVNTYNDTLHQCKQDDE